jgi:hypothetical protein
MPANVVLSLESFEGDRCVDVFLRPDGTFGIEEFRRDPEDAGEWYSIAQYPDQVFETKEEAVAYAKAHVPWLRTQAVPSHTKS